MSIIYPPKVLNRIRKTDAGLDVGMGKSKWAINLYSEGYNIQGFDLYAGSDRGPFRKADINDLTDSSYSNLDYIFSTWSIFTYRESRSFQQKSLAKMAAWLKIGGKIYLAPVNPAAIEKLLVDIPTLQMTDRGEGAYHYVELTKKPATQTIEPAVIQQIFYMSY